MFKGPFGKIWTDYTHEMYTQAFNYCTSLSFRESNYKRDFTLKYDSERNSVDLVETCK